MVAPPGIAVEESILIPMDDRRNSNNNNNNKSKVLQETATAGVLRDNETMPPSSPPIGFLSRKESNFSLLSSSSEMYQPGNYGSNGSLSHCNNNNYQNHEIVDIAVSSVENCGGRGSSSSSSSTTKNTIRLGFDVTERGSNDCDLEHDNTTNNEGHGNPNNNNFDDGDDDPFGSIPNNACSMETVTVSNTMTTNYQPKLSNPCNRNKDKDNDDYAHESGGLQAIFESRLTPVHRNSTPATNNMQQQQDDDDNATSNQQQEQLRSPLRPPTFPDLPQGRFQRQELIPKRKQPI